MNKKLKTIFFVIGIAVFTFLIFNFGIGNIIRNIQKTGWWFLPIIGIWGIVYLMNAWAWYFIIDGKNKDISFAETFSITLSGFAINYITPVVNLGGEPYRILALKESIGLHNSVSSTVLYTMIHFLSHFIFWLSAIVLMSIFSPLSETLKIIFAAASFVLIVAIYFFISGHKKGVLFSLYNLMDKIPFLKNYHKKLSSKEESIIKIDKEITDFYNKRRISFYASLSLDYFARIVASIEFYFILSSIGFDISILEAIYISAGSSLIMNILFFMPFELGTREGGIMLIMSGLKYTSAIGIYVGLVNRIREFFWILIGLILIQLHKNKTADKKILESI